MGVSRTAAMASVASRLQTVGKKLSVVVWSRNLRPCIARNFSRAAVCYSGRTWQRLERRTPLTRVVNSRVAENIEVTATLHKLEIVHKHK